MPARYQWYTGQWARPGAAGASHSPVWLVWLNTRMLSASRGQYRALPIKAGHACASSIKSRKNGPTRLAASKIFCMALGFTVASGAALAAAVAALCPSADLPARERHEESMPRPLGLPSSLSPSWLAAFRA